MEKKKVVEKDDLFAGSSTSEKGIDRANPMVNPLESVDDFKRHRDEDAEIFRRKQRDKIFKSKRRYEEEQPEFDISEIGPKVPANMGGANLQPMEEGKSAEPAVSLSDLPAIIQEFCSDIPDACLSGLRKLRRLLSAQGPTPVQEILDLGILPRLLTLLTCKEKSLIQLEAAWCITNIATGDENHVMAIVKKGGIELLRGVLDSPHRNNQEQAIWALGNIAGENSKFRDMVLDAGVLKIITRISKRTAIITLLKNCVWCLANLCRGKPSPPPSKVLPAVKALTRVLKKHSDTKLLTDASWSLHYIIEGCGDKISAILKTGIVPRLIELLMHEEPRVVLPVLRVIGGITTGNDEQTQIVVDAGVMEILKQLMQHKTKCVRKESCWVLSNIAAGSPSQLNAILETGLLPLVVNALKVDEFEVKREALWVICNISSRAKTEVLPYVIGCGIIEALCELLSVKEVRSLTVILQSLTNFLRKCKEISSNENEVATRIESCGGLATIESLECHPNQIVYKLAVDIIEKYFVVEEIEETMMQATGEEQGETLQQSLSIFKF